MSQIDLVVEIAFATGNIDQLPSPEASFSPSPRPILQSSVLLHFPSQPRSASEAPLCDTATAGLDCFEDYESSARSSRRAIRTCTCASSRGKCAARSGSNTAIRPHPSIKSLLYCYTTLTQLATSANKRDCADAFCKKEKVCGAQFIMILEQGMSRRARQHIYIRISSYVHFCRRTGHATTNAIAQR